VDSGNDRGSEVTEIADNGVTIGMGLWNYTGGVRGVPLLLCHVL
jgi:hypothetical protein